MTKAGIDQDALVSMFAEAGAKQGEALRDSVAKATLKSLQGRDLTLDSINKVVQTMAQSASLGAARNPAGAGDVQAMLGNALAGIDSALLQAVEANRKALEQFVGKGISVTEKPMQDAIANLEKMEDTFFKAIGTAAKSSGAMQAPWQHALAAMKTKGSETGAEATQTVEHLMAQAQNTLRESRATGMRAAQAMLDSYTAMVSGVLLGMSEGLAAGTSESAKAKSASSGSVGAQARSPTKPSKR